MTTLSSVGFLAGAGLGAAAGLAALKVKPSIFGSFAKYKGFAVMGSALVVGYAVSAVTSVTGYFSGIKKADRGREQFDLLKSQRDQATSERDIANAKVDGLEAQVTTLHQQMQNHEKFTDKIHSRAAAGGHAAAHEEHKMHEASAEHSI